MIKEICKHAKHILGGQECDVKQCVPNQAQGDVITELVIDILYTFYFL